METKTFLIVFFLFVVPALFGLLFGGSLANYDPPKGSLGAAKANMSPEQFMAYPARQRYL